MKEYFNKIIHSPSKHLLFLCLFSLLLSALFVTLNAYAVSPLYNQANLLSYDSPYFTLMGNKMLEEGAIPYVDFYDIKGPYLFYLEEFFCLIHPFYGAYIGQIFFSALSIFFLILALDKLEISFKKKLVLFSVYMIFAFAFMEGNVAEDLFLFIPSLSFYLFLLIREKPSYPRFLLFGFVEGALTGFLLFVKMNLLVFPGLLLCMLLYYSLKERSLGKCFSFLTLALIGFLLFVLPPIVFYASLGELDALMEWNFIREFAYLGTHSWEIERIFVYIISLALFLFFVLFFFFKRKNFPKEDIGIALFCLSVETLLALLSFVSMRHLRIALPLFIALSVFPLSLLKEEKKGVRISLNVSALFAYPFLVICCIGFLSYTYVTVTRAGDWVNDALEGISLAISEEEREEGSVLAIDMPCGVYFELDVLPEFVYPGYHSIHAVEYVPEMMDLVTAYIKEEATWVLVNDAPYEHPEVTPIYKQAEFQEALEEANFVLREDLTYYGLCLVYEKV